MKEMRKGAIVLLLALFRICSLANGQTIEPSVTFNPNTENYIIQYSVNGEIMEVFYEPPTKIEPVINVNVKLINKTTYIYSYQIKNKDEAEQRLFAFALEYYSPVSNITVPNDEWSSGKFTWAPIVDWAHTLADPSGVGTPRTGIAPGTIIKGFSFTSSGLPTIVTSYSEGFVKTLYFQYEPPIEITKKLRSIRKWPNNTIKKKTIGPTEPPKPFNPIAFLDTLSTYLVQSCTELNWITNQGICRSLEAKLENVERQLSRGNNSAASGSLQAFLNEVKALKGKQISSEAYALLYFNGRYLLERLQ